MDGYPRYADDDAAHHGVLQRRKRHTRREVREHLSTWFALSQEEIDQLIPSGKQTRLQNRVMWAHTYLSHAGLLNKIRIATYLITERGKTVLADKPARIDDRYLMRFPEYQEWKKKKPVAAAPAEKPTPVLDSRTPEEIFEDAYQEIRENLANELLEIVKSCPPAFFEQLVVDLLVKMGYGGSSREAARAVGKSGDEGIDGIIDEDRLGLDAIYIQAKRWNNGVVGRPEIQKFAGALIGKRASKGIFITTSSFSNDAISYATNIETHIVLINGVRLAELMVDYNVGVTIVNSYEIKRVDLDYFGNGG